MINDNGGNPMGPAITPKTTPGGGDARPPYLQARKPVMSPRPFGVGLFGPGGFAGNTPQPKPQVYKPTVTPKSTVVPGEVAPQAKPPVVKPTPPQAGGTNLGGVYNFMKSDLENEKNKALAERRADASARGVFYGSPLTGSEADIDTQYLRGLGQLDVGMYGNEQQSENQRLALAAQLFGMGGQGQPPASNGPLDFSGLASLFGQSPAVAGQRSGPVPPITKKNDTGELPKQKSDLG